MLGSKYRIFLVLLEFQGQKRNKILQHFYQHLGKKVLTKYSFLEVRKLIELPSSILIISRSSDASSFKRENYCFKFGLLEKINSCFLNDCSNTIKTSFVVRQCRL
jgi:hypothetical protein